MSTAVDDLLATAGADLLHAPAETSRTIEPKSDRWRRHVYTDDLPGDDPVSLIGLTSQLKPIKGNFEDYAAKVTAEWAVDNHAVWGRLERDAATSLIAHERTRKLNRDAARGTSIHKIIDQLAAGDTQVQLRNPDAAPYLAALKAFLAEARPVFVLNEVAVFNRTHRYAGKADAFVRFEGPAELVDLGLVVADWKTRAQHRVYLENAAQLAGYGKAEYYVLDGERHPMPEVTTGVVVTLAPDGTWAVHPVDLEAAWPVCEATVRCYQVEKIAKPLGTTIHPSAPTSLGGDAGTGEGAPGQAPAPGPALLTAGPDIDDATRARHIANAGQALRDRLGRAVHVLNGTIPAHLAWPAKVRKFADGGPRTWDGIKLVEDFVIQVEKAAQTPFEAPLPDDPFAAFEPPPSKVERPAPKPAKTERRDRFDELTDGWDDDTRRALILTATGGTPINPGDLTDRHLELVQLLLAGIDSDVLGLDVDESGTTVVVLPATELQLLRRYGGSKSALLTVAKAKARDLGRPVPTSSAKAVADPVLVAYLAAEAPEQGTKET